MIPLCMHLNEIDVAKFSDHTSNALFAILWSLETANDKMFYMKNSLKGAPFDEYGR